eukprot:788464-Prymnesium_polylepis.1
MTRAEVRIDPHVPGTWLLPQRARHDVLHRRRQHTRGAVVNARRRPLDGTRRAGSGGLHSEHGSERGGGGAPRIGKSRRQPPSKLSSPLGLSVCPRESREPAIGAQVEPRPQAQGGPVGAAVELIEECAGAVIAHGQRIVVHQHHRRRPPHRRTLVAARRLA